MKPKICISKQFSLISLVIFLPLIGIFLFSFQTSSSVLRSSSSRADETPYCYIGEAPTGKFSSLQKCVECTDSNPCALGSCQSKTTLFVQNNISSITTSKVCFDGEGEQPTITIPPPVPSSCIVSLPSPIPTKSIGDKVKEAREVLSSYYDTLLSSEDLKLVRSGSNISLPNTFGVGKYQFVLSLPQTGIIRTYYNCGTSTKNIPIDANLGNWRNGVAWGQVIFECSWVNTGNYTIRVYLESMDVLYGGTLPQYKIIRNQIVVNNK